MKLNPFIVLLNYFLVLFTGKVCISTDVESSIAFPSGYKPFLHVNAANPQSDTAVNLLVRFKVRSLNRWQRVFLPNLSIPFFAGAPGFVDKVFLLNESDNAFCGFYTWQSREDAQRYINSYPGKLMAKNALSGTLSIDIMPMHAH